MILTTLVRGGMTLSVLFLMPFLVIPKMECVFLTGFSSDPRRKAIHLLQQTPNPIVQRVDLHFFVSLLIFIHFFSFFDKKYLSKYMITSKTVLNTAQYFQAEKMCQDIY